MKKNLVTAAATAGLIFTAFGASASAQENTYTVQPGDTLTKIAKLNNVSINNLKAWNNLSSDKIYAYQKLSLNYTVQAGDTLWGIARAQGTTVSALKSTNGLNSDLIRIGQQLTVPVTKANTSGAVVANSSAAVSTNNTGNTSVSVPANQPADSSASVSANTNAGSSAAAAGTNAASSSVADSTSNTSSNAAASAPASAAASSPAADSASAAPNTYVVQKGDTLSEIGARYHLTVSELKSMNDLTSNKIIIGRILQLRSERIAANNAAAATASSTQTAAASTASQDTAKASAPTAASQPAAPAPQTAVKPAPAAPAAQPAAPAASQTAAAPTVQAVIAEAKKYMGTPYLWGGTSPSGFDCSGLVQYVFAKVGVSLPRTTSSQWSATTPVSSPSTGDLVFFETYKSGPSHVGIYLGGNQFISATDSGVKISDMTSSYWGPKYLGARKAL